MYSYENKLRKLLYSDFYLQGRKAYARLFLALIASFWNKCMQTVVVTNSPDWFWELEKRALTHFATAVMQSALLWLSAPVFPCYLASTKQVKRLIQSLRGCFPSVLTLLVSRDSASWLYSSILSSNIFGQGQVDDKTTKPYLNLFFFL